MKTFWRIFDDKDGLPHTLFHGVNGSRKIPLDAWLQAETKTVQDGSGVTEYQSGFHVLGTLEEVKEVLKQFKQLNHRVICRVWVDEQAGKWLKSCSRNKVWLVKRMKVTEADWRKRHKCTEVVNVD